jgi:hypothetical protein
MMELNLLYWMRGYLEAKDKLALEDVLKILDHLKITIQMPGSTAAWIKGYLDGIVVTGGIPEDIHLTLSSKLAQQIPEIEKLDFSQWYPAQWPFQKLGQGGTGGGLTFCAPEPSC